MPDHVSPSSRADKRAKIIADQAVREAAEKASGRVTATPPPARANWAASPTGRSMRRGFPPRRKPAPPAETTP